jgi:hypothetical protein
LPGRVVTVVESDTADANHSALAILGRHRRSSRHPDPQPKPRSRSGVRSIASLNRSRRLRSRDPNFGLETACVCSGPRGMRLRKIGLERGSNVDLPITFQLPNTSVKTPGR